MQLIACVCARVMEEEDNEFWDYMAKSDTIGRISATGGMTFAEFTPKSIVRMVKLMDIPPNAVVVDLGSGMGTWLLYVAAVWKRGSKFYGVELNKTLNDLAKTRLEHFLPEIETDVQFFEQSLTELKFDDFENWTNNWQLPLIFYSFDLRMDAEVREHVPKLLAAEVKELSEYDIRYFSTWNAHALHIDSKLQSERLPGLFAFGRLMPNAKYREYNRSNQTENYAEGVWEVVENLPPGEIDMEGKEPTPDWREMKRMVMEDPDFVMPEQLELAEMYKSTLTVKKSRTCENCEAPIQGWCGQCLRVAYCSVECQDYHWQYGGHKEVCSFPKK